MQLTDGNRADFFMHKPILCAHSGSDCQGGERVPEDMLDPP